MESIDSVMLKDTYRKNLLMTVTMGIALLAVITKSRKMQVESPGKAKGKLIS